MEGVGSRLGRASSRYGPAAAVFNGPVRKWKKKWVHVSSASTVSYQNPQSQSNGHNNNAAANGGSRLLLCRWTPVPPTTPAAAADARESVYGSGDAPDEPPRRKFRYTPVSSEHGNTHVSYIRVLRASWSLEILVLLKKSWVSDFSFLFLE